MALMSYRRDSEFFVFARDNDMWSKIRVHAMPPLIVGLSPAGDQEVIGFFAPAGDASVDEVSSVLIQFDQLTLAEIQRGAS
jgi:hypothetical protein